MGIGPVPAIQAMMSATGVSLGEVEQVSDTLATLETDVDDAD